MSEDMGKSFDFPLNIKQMGSTDVSLKVYLEDYVYTYLYQIAKKEGSGDKLAVLIGRHTVENGEDICMISGAIEGKFAEITGHRAIFTQESWNYINRQMELFFKGLCILGWAYIQPDFGTYLMPSEEAFHKECFKEKWQMLFIIDPKERLDAMYCFKDEFNMRRLKGYFIYYDKNEAMQNYMIENSTIPPKVPILEEEKQSVFTKFFFQNNKKSKKEEQEVPDRIDAAGRIRTVLNRKEEEKAKGDRARNIAVMAVCASLCLVSIMMCGNLISNHQRIRVLEDHLVSFQEGYYSDMSKVMEEATIQVVKVFKEQNIGVEDIMKEKTKTQEIVEVPKEVLAQSEYNVYWVEEGDNLWSISNKFYGTGDNVEIIMEANGLVDENLIYYGEKLVIPR